MAIGFGTGRTTRLKKKKQRKNDKLFFIKNDRILDLRLVCTVGLFLEGWAMSTYTAAILHEEAWRVGAQEGYSQFTRRGGPTYFLRLKIYTLRIFWVNRSVTYFFIIFI